MIQFDKIHFFSGSGMTLDKGISVRWASHVGAGVGTMVEMMVAVNGGQKQRWQGAQGGKQS